MIAAYEMKECERINQRGKESTINFETFEKIQLFKKKRYMELEKNYLIK